MLDEISTGLDSSTTFTIMSTMRQYTHVMNATMLCGLLQPQVCLAHTCGCVQGVWLGITQRAWSSTCADLF